MSLSSFLTRRSFARQVGLRMARANLTRPARISPKVLASAQAGVNTVRIVIQGRRLPVTPPIKEYVESKLSKVLSKFLDRINHVDVTLSARGGDTGTHGRREQKVDVTIYTLRHGVVRVEDAEENLYASIDVVCDKVERKLQKVKEKAIARGRWGAGAQRVEEQDYEEYLQNVLVDALVVDSVEEEEREYEALNAKYAEEQAQAPEVVRRKVVDLQPMKVAEAVEALEAVGHDFYVFRDSASGQVQVLYKRQESGYGLIVPK